MRLSSEDWESSSLRLLDELLARRSIEIKRTDWQLAQITQSIVNANRDQKKHREPFKIQRFMITEQHKETKTPEQMFDVVKALNKIYGGTGGE